MTCFILQKLCLCLRKLPICSQQHFTWIGLLIELATKFVLELHSLADVFRFFVTLNRAMKGNSLFIYMHQRKGQFTTVVTLSTAKFVVMRFVSFSDAYLWRFHILLPSNYLKEKCVLLFFCRWCGEGYQWLTQRDGC